MAAPGNNTRDRANGLVSVMDIVPKEDNPNHSEITIFCEFDGKHKTMTVECTELEYEQWIASGELIQRFFPEMPAEQREFLINGFTPEDWNEIHEEEE